MKKNFLLISCAIVTLSITGCANGVSQKDYDAVVAERDSLKSKNDELEQIRLESTKKILELQQQQTDKDLLNSSAIAWAETSFGENGIYLVENPAYMLCVAPGAYDTTLESINSIFNNVKVSTATLSKFADDIKYDKISIKYLSSENTTLIEFTLKRENDSYSLDGIEGDLMNASSLVAALSVLQN